MRIPVVQGIIDRRILINYQIDPTVLADLLPKPFEPKLVNGAGVAGICLIRLKNIRPKFTPAFLGISSENAAHRIAVQWKKNGELKEGVYIPRRDTSSKLNSLVGGKLFPGVHNKATFKVIETDSHFEVKLKSDDGETLLDIEAKLATNLPETSVFKNLEEASDFFESGSLGYSDTSDPDKFDGLELRSFNWKVIPLKVNKVASSFFEKKELFPNGSVKFDNALLMRGIDHEWQGRDTLYC
jgi:hypothetical protein